VLPQSGSTATSARLPVDIRRFPWIKPLAADHAHAFSKVAEFFAGDASEPGPWASAIARAQRHPRQREALAALVQAQQRRRGAPPEAVAAAAALRDPQSVAIVTGQQAVLFGGPMYVLLKAMTAIQLAARLRAEHHVPAVPVFWVEAEDHDWAEVQSCHVLDRDMNMRTIDGGEPAGAGERAVARVHLDDSVVAALAELEAALPASEFTAELLSSLRRCYTPGTGMADAFAAWIEHVLGPAGLVVYDASDPAAKPLAADLFAGEVAHPGRTARLAADTGRALEAHGYHAQVAPPADSVALFHMGAGREAIRYEAGRFVVGERQMSGAELTAHVRGAPQEFSPNVLLRPLVQDTLFPTACYVAGPNELAYLAQLAGVYHAFGLPYPLIHQRATATLLDANAMRFLGRHDVPLEALRAQDEATLNELLAAQLPPSVEASMQDAMRAVDERMATLADAVPQIDPTLEGAARSTLGRMQDDLKKLHGKIIQAAKRKDETLRRQYHHARVQAFPGGQPQEREVAFVHFLNKYGPALVERLRDELPADQGTHWVITV
jgi:bacillithiol biosynthesis cysteine-adding enzyme BshC